MSWIGALALLTGALVGVACIAADFFVHPPSSMIRRVARLIPDAWSRWHDRRYDRYWGANSAAGSPVAATLSATGDELRSGCACGGCACNREELATILGRITDSDVTELDRIGITWNPS